MKNEQLEASARLNRILMISIKGVFLNKTQIIFISCKTIQVKNSKHSVHTLLENNEGNIFHSRISFELTFLLQVFLLFEFKRSLNLLEKRYSIPMSLPGLNVLNILNDSTTVHYTLVFCYEIILQQFKIFRWKC